MRKFLSTPNNIKSWLLRHEISDYELIEDSQYGYVVDVFNDVELSERKLTKIAVKFNEIHNGGFFCQNNLLSSLQGAPHTVHGDVYAGDNRLKNLVGSPRNIKADFFCHANYLTSLKGCSTIIEGYFNADCNNLNKYNLKLSDLPAYALGIDLSGNMNLFDYQHITTLEKLKIALEKDLLSKSISEPIIIKTTYKI